MSKTLIFSAPQGNAPDIVLKIDDTGRHLTINTGGLLDNRGSYLFTANTGINGGGGAIVNTGTFGKTGGTGQSTLTNAFSNVGGTLNISSGWILDTVGFSHSGTGNLTGTFYMSGGSGSASGAASSWRRLTSATRPTSAPWASSTRRPVSWRS